METKMRLSITVLAALGALMLASVAGAEQRYTDATGDSGAAPDLGQVAVSNDSGQVVFRVSVPARLPEPDEAYFLAIDSDGNVDTGKDGLEVRVFQMAVSSNVDTWNGSEWVDAPSGGISLRMELTGETGVWVVTLPRTLLANTTAFSFWLMSAKFNGDEMVASDDAPDGNGAWRYELALKQCSNGQDDDRDGKTDIHDLGCSDGEDDLESDDPYTLAIVRPSVTPAVVRTGTPITIKARVTQVETKQPITTGAVRCTAKIGTATRRWAGRLTSGTAVCALRAPKVSKPTSVKGSITVSSKSKTATAPFAFRVR